MNPDPLGRYRERHAHFSSEAAQWGRREQILSNARLLVFLAALGLGWLAFGSRTLSPVWFVLSVVGFVALVVVHDRVIGRRRRADRCSAFYEHGIARIEDRWHDHGETGEAHAEPDHPYADDLDLFGRGSLFQLLCLARTPAGEAKLAHWLAAPASPAEIRARQAAIEELRERLELREELALIGDEVRSKLHPGSLIAWGANAGRPAPAWLRGALLVLTAAQLAAAALWLTGAAPPIAWVGLLAVQIVVALVLRSRVRTVLHDFRVETRDLRLLRQLLFVLEKEPFSSPRLEALRHDLDVDGLPPSRQLARLERLIYLLEARRNQFFAPIGALLLWSTQIALAVEHWRAACGPSLSRWIEDSGDFEALCSLAAYAYEHPADPFPEIVEGDALFDGRALGHPLLPAASCVRNDVTLGGERRAYLLSGSNMSGKSTLLRTVGVNALLAQAGAPVRATRLRMSPLAIAASIRVRDSLQAGVSHFYAEIQQLRRVVEQADAGAPVLFLLDELLHGTNSHDRRIGAEAVLRGLVERGAIGLCTTHDLALAKIADELAPRMENIHLQDHLEDGVMTFDYRVRPGVVTKSNALELMRSVGLDV